MTTDIFSKIAKKLKQADKIAKIEIEKLVDNILDSFEDPTSDNKSVGQINSAKMIDESREEWRKKIEEMYSEDVEDYTRPVEKPEIPWPDPTHNQMDNPLFETIWQCIKKWDINVPNAYVGYCGATGNHVAAIMNALSKAGYTLIQQQTVMQEIKDFKKNLISCMWDFD